MFFAIRDDDIDYWTSPADLEFIYGPLFEKGLKVSFSVIPYGVETHNRGNRRLLYQDVKPRPVGENKELVSYLKDKIREKLASILLHGYTHQYKVTPSKRYKPVLATKKNLYYLRQKYRYNILWIGEYRWKEYKQLHIETKDGKEYLEDLFHTKVSIFVPPSNDISSAGVKAVSDHRLNISGTVYLKKFNRIINVSSIKNILLRLLWKYKYGRIYPYVMDYVHHKELCTYGFVPTIVSDFIYNQFNFCYVHNAPFVLSTHHWELKSHPRLYLAIVDFINEIIKKKEVKMCVLDDLYK